MVFHKVKSNFQAKIAADPIYQRCPAAPYFRSCSAINSEYLDSLVWNIQLNDLGWPIYSSSGIPHKINILTIADMQRGPLLRSDSVTSLLITLFGQRNDTQTEYILTWQRSVIRQISKGTTASCNRRPGIVDEAKDVYQHRSSEWKMIFAYTDYHRAWKILPNRYILEV